MTSYKSRNENKWGNPPPGYIPGYDGRGAVGFTTRSDIGNARNFADAGGAYPTGVNVSQNNNMDKGEISSSKKDDEVTYQPYDKWSGNDAGLLNTKVGETLDDEDREAETVYNQIEMYLEDKKSSGREKKIKKHIEDFSVSNQAIRNTFSDLKGQLTYVSAEEWNNIPEVDKVVKKKKADRFSVVPDHIIQTGLAESTRLAQAIEIQGKSGSGTTTMICNLDDVSTAKNQVLSVTLDRLSVVNNDSKNGRISVNSVGYLTELMDIKKNQYASQDLNKNRKILSAVIEADKSNVMGYICLARLEELDGNIKKAREIILEAAENITDCEDVWEEAARLYPYKDAVKFLQKGLSYIPSSTRLWISYANRESNATERIKIYEQALNHVSYSETIWKNLISLADEDLAKAYLSKAVDCCSNSVDLWLAYAKLEEYGAAKEILNRARKQIGSSLAIWIAATKLEETNFSAKTQPNASDYESKKSKLQDQLRNILNKCHKSLGKNGVSPSRDAYIQESETAEKSNCLMSCESIIQETLSRDKDLDSGDRYELWKVLIEKCIYNKSINTARFIYKELFKMDSNNISIWLAYLKLETKYGNTETQEYLFELGISNNPNLEVIWIMYAKHLYSEKRDIDKAISILVKGYAKLEQSEEILISLSKLYVEKRNFETSEKLFYEYISAMKYGNKVILCRETTELNSKKYSHRLMMKYIQLFRIQGKYDKAIEICDKITNLYNDLIKAGEAPESDIHLVKIYLVASQLQMEKENSEINKSISILLKAIDFLPNYPILYISAAKLFCIIGNTTKARTILETGRLKNKESDIILYEIVKQEYYLNNLKNATKMLSKGLQDFPKSSKLLALSIALEPVHQRETKAADTLNILENDPLIMLEIAKLTFTIHKNIDKSIKWLENIIKINPDFGDAWIYLYLLNNKLDSIKGVNYSKKHCDDIEEQCNLANPRHGDIWTTFSKQMRHFHSKPSEILKVAFNEESALWKAI